MDFQFNGNLGGFHVGDLCWSIEQTDSQNVLWPAIVKSKSKVTKNPQDSDSEAEDPVQFDPLFAKVEQRLRQFASTRYVYTVMLLSKDVVTRPDVCLVPFSFTTKPTPSDDPLYCKAIIQAIQIQSSWAYHDEDEKSEFNQRVEYFDPPLKDPIHISCPLVSGT